MTIHKAKRTILAITGAYIAPVVVSIAPIRHRKQTRLTYKVVVKDQFREACAEVFGRRALHNRTCHHIKPIFLYGTNDFENLIWLPERIHKACHFLIDDQIHNMRPSERREILLPMFRNLRLV